MLSITNVSNFKVGHGLFAVKFWATWCQPCKIFAPTVEKLDEEFENINFLSIDVDQVSEIVKEYKIRSLPTILILNDGEEIERITGAQLIEPLRTKFREIEEKYCKTDKLKESERMANVAG